MAGYNSSTRERFNQIVLKHQHVLFGISCGNVHDEVHVKSTNRFRCGYIAHRCGYNKIKMFKTSPDFEPGETISMPNYTINHLSTDAIQQYRHTKMFNNADNERSVP